MPGGAELGFRSESIFHRFDGEVVDRRAEHGCLVVRTPANPTFFWGNYLLFDAAPRSEDAERWPRLFEQLIGRVQPASTHRAFGWLEDAAGEPAPFLAAGYQRNDTAVLQTVRPPAPAPARIAADLRPFCTQGPQADAEWAAQLALDMSLREAAHEAAAYREFCRRRHARWRAMIAAGRGQWFGAFVAGDGAPRLAASLGVFAEAAPVDGERLGRYQWVSTHPDYQRRGLCRALLAQSARHACDVLRVDRLVIAAEAGGRPERIYREAGFTPVGCWRGLQRMP